MTIRYLDEGRYLAATSGRRGHWKNAGARWDYHKTASDLVRMARPPSARDVLEMGTMGVQVVEGSDTIDYAEKWNHAGPDPTFLHDARQLPWPIASKRYHVFVALRVFHHLWPKQRECFLEARRIARHIVMVVPDKYEVAELRDTSVGITEAQLVEWNDGVAPTLSLPLADWIGRIYYWSEDALRGR
jgi:hypothetical protein